MWGNISSLQLIVHLPINQVEFPANALVLFEALIKVVTFDFLNIRDVLGVDADLNFTPTSPFNENFDKLGYGSQNTIDNLGTINFIIIGMLLHILIFVALQAKCAMKCEKVGRCKSKYYSDWSDLSQMVLQFMLQTILELLICSMVTNLPSDQFSLFDAETWTPADKFMLGFTIAIQICSAAFLVLSLWFAFFKLRPIQSQFQQEILEE